MGIVVGLGGLIALIALILKAQLEGKPHSARYLTEKDAKPYAQGLPESVKTTIMRGEEATRTELEVAASAANVVGYHKLSDALREKADKAPETSGSKKIPASPWEPVTNQAWMKFVKAMATGQPGTIGPRGNVGIFQTTVRRLTDLGIMKNPRKTGGNGTWTADWNIEPQRFLSDPPLQYKLFERSMSQYRQAILTDQRFADTIGREIDGRKVTLSGLLAVAHFTGLEGLGKWLANNPPREKFKSTSAAFARANGIF